MTDAEAEQPDWLSTLTDALSEQSRLDHVVAIRPGIGARPAAVLILIGEGPAGPEIMFIERAASMRTHAGQIAFPGGAADADDLDLADTALREAAEETGLDRSGIEVLGVLPPAHVDVSGFDVTAVIAWWREPSPVAVMDSREAASIDIVPVAVLTDPAHRVRVQHPSGYSGPGFEVNGHLIWGLTAHLLDGVLDLAGWQRPWDRQRVVAIPARYLTDSRRPDRGGPDAH
jgi:8-oxo-dGTP pyrophosphatase MutT (NUDIX family)